MNDFNIADMISNLRKSKNMTQKQLAEKLGVTDKAVSKWERGLSYPDITILPSLAKELGVTADELLAAKEERTPEGPERYTRIAFEYGEKTSHRHRSDISVVIKAAVSFTLIITIVIGIWIFFYRDISTFKALTASMTPTINPGDKVVVKTISFEDIKVDDIITFRINDAVITHRVVDIVQGNNGKELVTKGDANTAEDPGTVTEDQVIGRVIKIK